MVERFGRICEIMGISQAYRDIWGNLHQAALETLMGVLQGMGFYVSNENQVLELQRELEERLKNEPFLKRVVFQGDGRPILPINIHGQPPLEMAWEITSEQGEVFCGGGQVRDTDLKRAWDKKRGEVTTLNVLLPESLGIGYHKIRVFRDGREHGQTMFILAPKGCYLPHGEGLAKPCWGLQVQLYSLKSGSNGGVGDLGDLQSLAHMLRPWRPKYFAVNPLHALFSSNPSHTSPYSPSTRLFLNPIYLPFGEMVEWARDEKGDSVWGEALFSEGMRRLRDGEWVSYEEIWPIKLSLLKAIYQRFLKGDLSEKAKDLLGFKSQKGRPSYFFGIFEALTSYFRTLNENLWGWPVWPPEFQSPHSQEVIAWSQRHAQDVDFYIFVHWLVEERLKKIKEGFEARGLGLYLDLPVGVDQAGFEPWYYQDLFAKEINIGAPQDEFNPLGQDWGLPPITPHRLVEQDFKYFIDTIRFNMSLCHILRIDHVMGLRRLFWIPRGLKPEHGTYVLYPFEELVGILCVESVRNKCMVIGEDLGTVPDEVREVMDKRAMFSSAVFIFEKENEDFKVPSKYKRLSVASFSTHDLPTLRGFWEKRDIEVRDSLSLFQTEGVREKYINLRYSDKTQILKMLISLGYLSKDIEWDLFFEAINDELVIAIHRFLAQCNSLIVMIQPEDAIYELEQKNLPGTSYEYPNWRKKIPIEIEKLPDHYSFRKVLEIMKYYRG